MTDNQVPVRPRDEQAVSNDRRQKYVSTRGVVAYFSPMPVTLRDRIVESMVRDGFEEPRVPTYEVEILGDEETKEIHEHDETTIVGDEEATAQWEAYLADQEKYDGEINSRLNKACRILCMEVPGVLEKEWIKQQEFLGFIVPKDELERKLYYIENIFIGSRDDIVAVIQIPIQLTMQRTGALKIAEDMFRAASVERQKLAEKNSPTTIGRELEMAEGRDDGPTDVGEAEGGT